MSVILLQVISVWFFAKPYFLATKETQMYNMYNDVKMSILIQDDITDIMSHYQEAEGIHIAIWDTKLNLVYTKENKELTVDPKLFSSDPIVERKLNKTTNSERLYLYGKLTDGADTYFVAIDTPISAIDRSIELINNMNIAIASIVLLIGGILSWFWATRFTKPIMEIDQVARNVSKLDFTKKLEVKSSYDELSRLSESINLMSDHLSSMIYNLSEANEQLEQDVDYQKKIDQMRKEFIANVSHELKSPLGLLVMYCDNLKNDVPGIDKDFYYDVIMDESTRLSGLVTKLLEISSLENGMAKMVFHQVDLSNLVTWLCSKKEVMFSNYGIPLEWVIEERLYVKGDAFYLEQAINNFIDNAFKHTNGQEAIRVELSDLGTEVKFTVTNTGDIVSSEDLEHIWESFYKVDKSHTPSKETHAGLGLYIVKTIIESHNGSYNARQTDSGMEFSFTIPKGEFIVA